MKKIACTKHIIILEQKEALKSVKLPKIRKNETNKNNR